jgi:hypothetical protein
MPGKIICAVTAREGYCAAGVYDHGTVEEFAPDAKLCQFEHGAPDLNWTLA